MCKRQIAFSRAHSCSRLTTMTEIRAKLLLFEHTHKKKKKNISHRTRTNDRTIADAVRGNWNSRQSKLSSRMEENLWRRHFALSDDWSHRYQVIPVLCWFFFFFTNSEMKFCSRIVLVEWRSDVNVTPSVLDDRAIEGIKKAIYR